eukprot:2338293-Rhodomonas_salina.3
MVEAEPSTLAHVRWLEQALVGALNDIKCPLPGPQFADWSHITRQVCHLASTLNPRNPHSPNPNLGLRHDLYEDSAGKAHIQALSRFWLRNLNLQRAGWVSLD